MPPVAGVGELLGSAAGVLDEGRTALLLPDGGHTVPPEEAAEGVELPFGDGGVPAFVLVAGLLELEEAADCWPVVRLAFSPAWPAPTIQTAPTITARLITAYFKLCKVFSGKL